MHDATQATSLQQLRDDIGGALLLDRKVLAVLLPGALLTSVLTRDPTDLRSAIAWTGVNLAALTLIWLWSEFARAFIVPRRALQPAHVTTVLALGASIGLLKGVATSIFAWTAGLVSTLLPAPELWRALGTTIQVTLILPAVTLAAATLARYRSEYEQLVSERARHALLGADTNDAYGDVARARLLSTFALDAQQRLSSSEGRAVASMLEHLVQDQLRPMTRQLWTPARVGTDFTPRSLVRAAILANPFPTGLVASAYAVTTAVSRAQGIALGINVVRTLVSIVTIWAVFSLARRWRSSRPRRAALHLLATLTSLAALQTFVVEQIFTAGLRWNAASMFVSLFVWLTTLTVLAGAAMVAVQGGDRVRTELARVLDLSSTGISDVERASRLLRDRELADHLHSVLQNRLISAARRITASGESATIVREELGAIDVLLDELVRGAPERDPAHARAGSSARAQIAEVIARWEGFVHVTTTLSDDLDALPQRMQDRVAQLLVEALNNAIRHGRATAVDIRAVLTGTPGVMELTIEDDGIGPVMREPGLGSALFTAMSGGDWRLEPRDEGGSRITLRLRTA
jgi:anti-sigma regulatory factor (Ser/Thr protein kinase)